MTNPRPLHASRRDIYYWKCDRPAAFHGTQSQRQTAAIEPQILTLLQSEFPDDTIRLRDGGSQGNHLTWIVEIGSRSCFLRVEDGPERSNHLEVESHIIDRVREQGVKTPEILRVDAGRREVPFAWQLMELIPARNLNHELKQGRLDAATIACEIGIAVARWQNVPVAGFGHFDPTVVQNEGRLQGYHPRYRDYFFLNWERHLGFLEERAFLTSAEVRTIRNEVARNADLLERTAGCLVHKDLAFWNILGDQSGVAAYIDWDDAVAADEMDDLSLLGCFHDGPVIAEALKGYISIKPRPPDHEGRFWLHLLRNMIFKSVIRVGAGYFDRSDGFFLVGTGLSGDNLRQQTRSRISRALDGLRSTEPPESL